MKSLKWERRSEVMNRRPNYLRPVTRGLRGLGAYPGVPSMPVAPSVYAPMPMSAPAPMPIATPAPVPQFTDQQRAYIQESIEQVRPKVWDALLIAGVTGGIVGWLI